MFLFRKRFWLTLLKLILLAFVTWMIRLQIPELRYDLGTKTPVRIAGPADLAAQPGDRPTFAAVEGKVDFDKAFVHNTHGVTNAYFLIEGYDNVLVVRSYEKVTDDWRKLDRHVGRLKTYHRMPFSRTIRTIFRDRFKVEVPPEAWFLARDDVPRPSAWQIGAVIFATALWCVLLYFFFIRRKKTLLKQQNDDSVERAGEVSEGPNGSDANS